MAAVQGSPAAGEAAEIEQMRAVVFFAVVIHRRGVFGIEDVQTRQFDLCQPAHGFINQPGWSGQRNMQRELQLKTFVLFIGVDGIDFQRWRAEIAFRPGTADGVVEAKGGSSCLRCAPRPSQRYR